MLPTPRFPRAVFAALSLACAVRAELSTVFDDTFGDGSTINNATPAPATPSLRATAYQQLSGKAFQPVSVGPGALRFGLPGTSSAFTSIQALFTQYPVTLADTGDSVRLSVTFTPVADIVDYANSGLCVGLHNAGQTQPKPGGINGTQTTALAGHAAAWQGYIDRIMYAGGAHQILFRPAQADTSANNQDLTFSTSWSPAATTIGSLTTSTFTDKLLAATPYRVDLVITRTGATTLDIASDLHLLTPGLPDTLLVSKTVSSTSVHTDTFDGLVFGYYARAASTGSAHIQNVDVNRITVTTTAATTIVPVIGTQPLSQTQQAGDPVHLVVTANGGGAPAAALSYQWYKNDAAITLEENPTARDATLSLPSPVVGDSGDYHVVVTNIAGSTPSDTASLTISDGAVAPQVLNPPTGGTALVGGAKTFTVLANGTAPLSHRWEKSLDNVTFTEIPDATGTSLTLDPITTADAGHYRVVVSNSLGSATSPSVALVVGPVLTTTPLPTIVAPGAPFTISCVADVGAGSPEPVTYVWKRDGATVNNGANVSGATTADLAIAAFSSAESGYYTVTASNSAGTVTSDSVYIGLASTQSVTFAPGNNATGIAIDQQLRLVFPGGPKLGRSGALRVHDAATDSIVATIDVAQFVSYAPGNSSAQIPNAAIRSVQSGTGTTNNTYYYTPVAIYGNEAWITLGPTQRLAYGKTYYVTMDAGLLLDSTNASFPGISDSATWRFSTKAAGPATPTTSTGPTTITVGQDGAGDFATLQGAFDWIPQNNTLRRTVQVLPGSYRDSATLAQNRDFVTIVGTGALRTDAQIIYPYAYFAPPSNVFTAGTLRIESSDVTVRNLTLDNLIYYPYSPTGRSADTNSAFSGATNTLATTGKRLVFDDLLIKGGQDTVYTVSGIAYFNGCEIWGSVDFIYGAALAVLEDCDIVQVRTVGGPVCAPSTPLAQPYGEVLLNCRFPRALVANGYPYDVNIGSTTFMRPWRQDGATAIINCQLDTHISTKGWLEWVGTEGNKEVTCRAREYGSTLIGGGAAPTIAQRQAAGAYWLNTIDPDYTGLPMEPSNSLLAPATGTGNRQQVTVNPADYTLAAIFGHPYFALNGWMPALAPRVLTPPDSLTVTAGQSATFTVVASGTPAPTYQWFQNEDPIPDATSATYTIPTSLPSHAGSYTVVVTNSAGTVTSTVATLAVTSSLSTWAGGHGLDSSAAGFASADADGDGVANLLEYLLDGDPTTADSAILPVATTVDASGERSLVLDYDRSTAAAASLILSVEISDDLGAWDPVTPGEGGVTQQVTALDAQREHVRVAIPVSGPHLFARLRASTP